MSSWKDFLVFKGKGGKRDGSRDERLVSSLRSPDPSYASLQPYRDEIDAFLLRTYR